MSGKKVVVWGAAGHALVVAEIIRLNGNYEIAGFIDDINPQRKNNKFCGASILGGAEQLDYLIKKGIKNLIFGFGDCLARLKLAKLVQKKGFNLITAVHPRAVVANGIKIGAGTVVAAGAVINPGAEVGCNAIINTCASVDHECVIEDGAHLCPGVHLGGRVKVGRGAWVGIGATVKDGVEIGQYSLVGAGSLVLTNVPSQVEVYGLPARVKRSLKNP